MFDFFRKRLRKPQEAYRGLAEGCAPGTHQKLIELLDRAGADRNGGTLDLGSYTGSLLRRLQDAGYSDLHASDRDTTSFSLPGIPHTFVDLNERFSERFDRRFSVIVCTDVIEHLDSPRQFIEEAHNLLKDDGLLGLTFPNVAFWEGRIKFLLTGELWGFGQRNYVIQRHISPTTIEQITLMLRELGFDPISVETAGSFATPLRKILFAPIWLPLRLIGGRPVLGESLIIVARRTSPNAELKMPMDYRDRWTSSGQREAGAGANSASETARA